MKKCISWILGVVLAVFCIGCKKADTQTFTATAEYGYAVGTSGKAELIYGGCTPFFELPDDEKVIAGDVFLVEYTGMMYVLQSYPGQVRIQDGKIVGVTKKKAEIIQLFYTPSDGSFTTEADGEKQEIAVYDSPDFYIADADTGAYFALGSLSAETVLYGAYSPLDGFEKGKGYRFSAFYTADPRAHA